MSLPSAVTQDAPPPMASAAAEAARALAASVRHNLGPAETPPPSAPLPASPAEVDADAEGARASADAAAQSPRSGADDAPPADEAPPPSPRPSPPRKGAAEDAAGAIADVAAPAEPASLVGRRVRRPFLQGGLFNGVITGARCLRPHGWMWHVRYEDGDREELTWQELRPFLVAAGGDADTQPQMTPEVDAPLARDAAGAASAAASPPPPAAECGTPAARAEDAQPPAAMRPVFKGVREVPATKDSPVKYAAQLTSAGWSKVHGGFPTAAAAAHAYDKAARKLGRRVVNFPRSDSNEVQAVYGESDALTLRRYGQAAAVSPAPLPPPAKKARRARSSVRAPSPRPRRPPAAAAAAAKDALVGQRVRVPFRDGGVTKLFDGTVLCRCAGRSLRVRFDDGDTDELSAAEVRRYSIQDAAPHVADAATTNKWYRGVHRAPSGSFSAELRANDGARIYLGGAFTSAQDAAAAVDAEARRRGLLHRINFPRNAKERAAVDEYLSRPHIAGRRMGLRMASPSAPRRKRDAAAAEDSDEDGGGAAAPVTPPPKRQRMAEEAAARPRTRAAREAGAAAAPKTAAAAPPAAAAACSGAEGPLSAFLRGITPPLQHLAAILKAVPRSGLTQEHLACLARTDAASPQFALLRQDILSGLGIETTADKFSFTRALLRTWQA